MIFYNYHQKETVDILGDIMRKLCLENLTHSVHIEARGTGEKLYITYPMSLCRTGFKND